MITRHNPLTGSVLVNITILKCLTKMLSLTYGLTNQKDHANLTIAFRNKDVLIFKVDLPRVNPRVSIADSESRACKCKLLTLETKETSVKSRKRQNSDCDF